MSYNLDIENIHTPVQVDKLKSLLESSAYPAEESDYLINGFKNGFDLEYNGPNER